MRRLGDELGVEAMSLYHHVRSKEEVVDGMVGALMDAVPVPPPGTDWRMTIRARALAAREVFRPHPWAARVLASRGGPGDATLRYMDWVVGVLRAAGFTREAVHSAVHVIGGRLLGLDLEPFAEGIRPVDAKALGARLSAGEFPAIAEAIQGIRHDDEREFAFGLDVILDGLERVRTAAPAARGGRSRRAR